MLLFCHTGGPDSGTVHSLAIEDFSVVRVGLRQSKTPATLAHGTPFLVHGSTSPFLHLLQAEEMGLVWVPLLTLAEHSCEGVAAARATYIPLHSVVSRGLTRPVAFRFNSP